MDHRDAQNRDQMRYPSDAVAHYLRAVERLAEDLQVHLTAAHHILRNGCAETTIGLIWERYL